ncbi:MAG TPA: beta-ketoacyl-ACP synthase II [Smithellaceae bacterium]|jgi:3-oxoacyl-[acyl-carrier-protein] synthase II|nr:beta-ketoacyl-ACP synthase II [Syntrophaceae bacterium]NMC90429.1 beta-ketoacyl-ACP synthase II [Smithella sp.]OQC73902.1 MAG: 3-oxoacyl-(acyl-carrier-protein) synthase 2 [Deltaproteobacteria bacterium ADurb.Bin002]HNY97039.1 beta-ketoacyl-ACP synthase II [Smithellaceae bacterium]MBP8666897.1 beta-ketoacyl-ACP synthase II [Syntrophaceae bacterium]
MKRRVVITGLGAVTPLGNTAAESWANAVAGKSGIGPITRFDASAYASRVAGEIRNFDPLQYVDKKEVRRQDKFAVYALAASQMAMDDAALTLGPDIAERVGVLIGSAIGGAGTFEEEAVVLHASGPRKISPFSVPAILANLASGHVSMRFGAKGPINCAVTACASGTSALGDAYKIIAYGDADAMIAGGVEAAITPLSVAGFCAMRALSLRNDEPEKASRPFDKGRDGFVIAEGSGVVILEELSFALNRGAKIYAELVGYGCTSDAYHLAAPPPGHEGAGRCMKVAIQDAGLQPADIDYINAHGTSTPLNDLYETQAIKALFGEHAKRLLISSTKSMTGHMLGGTGAVEAIFTVKALQEGRLPPTVNLDDPDEECDLDFVPNVARRQDISTALSNSFGFGGVNAVLVFKKYAP